MTDADVARSVGGGGVDDGLDHELGVHAGVAQRFGGPGAPAGAGRRRRPRMRRLPVRPQHRAPAAPAAGSRSVVRPYVALKIIRCESLRF